MTEARTFTAKFTPRKSDPNTGNWYVYVRPPLPNGKSLIPIKGYSRRAEDAAAVDAWVQKYRAGYQQIQAEPKRLTADGWMDRFVKSRMGKVSTVDTDHKQWLKWISSVNVPSGGTFGAKAIADINGDDVECVRDVLNDAIGEWEAAGKKRGAGLAYATAKNVWSILTTACKHAFTRKGVRTLRVRDAGNPAEGIAPPKVGRAKRRHWCRSAWINAALASPKNDDAAIKEAVAIGVGLHLRPGELHEVRVRDLALDESEVSITRSYDEPTKTVKDGAKTDDGVRTVTIPSWLMPLLTRIAKERKPNERVAPWLAATSEHDRAPALRAFLKNGGAAPDHVFVDTATHEAVDFRTVRDSGITLRFLAGERAEVVQREAGHRHVTTTLGYAKEVANKGGRYGDAFLTLPSALVGDAPDARASATIKASNDGAQNVGGASGYAVCAASCEVDGNCEVDPLILFRKMVARVGFEGSRTCTVARLYPRTSHDSQPIVTSRDVTMRADFTRLAAKARLLVQLSSGDVRVLAEDIAHELAALAGPAAEVVSFADRRLATR